MIRVFLLLAALDLFDDAAGVCLGEVWADELGEHAVPEVGLDDDMVDRLLLGKLDDGGKGGLAVAFLIGPHCRDVQVAVQHLHDAHGGFVLASSSRVNRHDGTCVREPCAVEESGAMYLLSPFRPTQGTSFRMFVVPAAHMGFSGASVAEHDMTQIPELEGVLLHVGEPGVEHELELEPAAPIREFAFRRSSSENLRG